MLGGGHSPTLKGLHAPSPSPEGQVGGPLLPPLGRPPSSPLSPQIMAPQLIPSHREPGAETWPSIPTMVPWRRKRQPPPVLLPGKPHGQRSLEGDTPWGLRESDTPEQLSTQHGSHHTEDTEGLAPVYQGPRASVSAPCLQLLRWAPPIPPRASTRPGSLGQTVTSPKRSRLEHLPPQSPSPPLTTPKEHSAFSSPHICRVGASHFLYAPSPSTRSFLAWIPSWKNSQV